MVKNITNLIESINMHIQGVQQTPKYNKLRDRHLDASQSTIKAKAKNRILKAARNN